MHEILECENEDLLFGSYGCIRAAVQNAFKTQYRETFIPKFMEKVARSTKHMIIWNNL